MKQFFTKLALCAGLFGTINASAANLWQKTDVEKAPVNLQVIHPTKFLVYTVDEASLKFQMWNLSTNPDEAIRITLPMPDGTTKEFRVWQTPMMPAELAAKYPSIKTFTGAAIGDARITAKLDFTEYGFHAMIFDGDKTSFIDPFDHYKDGFYMVHYKNDEQRAYNERMKCVLDANHEQINTAATTEIGNKVALPSLDNSSRLAARTVNGHKLRTYRLALCADDFYCQAATGVSSPTIAACLSCMTTSMNRINGVYEREFSVTMTFVTHEDTLIWPTHTGSINGTDPFYSIDANASSCLTMNQTKCDTRIGSANYDIGHVFTTGGGGLSSLGCVCNATYKAQSVTGSPTPVGDGYDIDYVAHEMGHEFGSEHTFNNNFDGSCGGSTAVAAYAYEPGSGVTIMAYGGICSPDDLWWHSIPIFCASSLVQIITYLNGAGNVCAVSTTTGNLNVALPTFSANYTVPYKTPFELAGPTAVDSVADTANLYSWEQNNLGDFGKRFVQTFKKGPIFRDWNRSYAPTRIFPKDSMVVAGVLSNAGTEGWQGEKAPDTARYLTFKLTVQDIYNGNGCITYPDDTIHINAVSTGASSAYQGFKVTSPSTAVSWAAASTQTITWNVVGTNSAPVSCDSVDVYVSVDGGYSWPYYVGRFINNGSASITVPGVSATTNLARIKVKGKNNVFFNINRTNFTITYVHTTHIVSAQWADGLNVYPVPTSNLLHIADANNNDLQIVITNEIGQVILKTQMNKEITIPVGNFAKGIYYVQFINIADGQRSVKTFVVN